MSQAIFQAFNRAKAQGRAAFIPFITAGFPDESTFLSLITTFDRVGADLIEIGLPFTDPLADGPIIQAASQQVISQGINPARVLDLLPRVVSLTKAPIVLMTYYHPVWRYGLAPLATRLREAGVAGTIIPDLPVEEVDEWLEAAQNNGLGHVFMLAPTTTAQRLERILSLAKSFIYYVSMTGVTGTALSSVGSIISELGRIRHRTSTPVAVGFGVDGPDQAAALAPAADGVIVGSALIRAIQNAQTPAEQISAVESLAGDIKKALHRNGQPAVGRP